MPAWDSTGRTCTTCHTHKPRDHYYPLSHNRAHYADGHQAECKTCWRTREAKRPTPKPKIKLPRPYHDHKGRTCARCHRYKFWTAYPKKKNGINGHREHCRTCTKDTP